MTSAIREKPKKLLLLSYGPVPVPEQDKVEGGGLRIWGLAKGIAAQNKDIEITVAYKRDYAKGQPTEEFEGINVTTWVETEIKSLIANYDSVVVSYCLGELSNAVAKHIAPNQQLILDCYVPIYVEISARQSDNLEEEYSAFIHEVKNWDKVLRRGDLFLCANANQKRYYQGVLSALGRVNPATYEDDLILIVPYGVYKEKPQQTHKPIEKLLATTAKDGGSYKKLLWFGGIYPWFDIKTLIDAVDKVNQDVPVKLVIVGAKNPFNAHPDFIKSYENLVEYVSLPEHRDNVVMQDWVEFDDRANWYLDSDLVILINKTGEENQLAWRTRLVDYIWADLPIITNAGDPLGEELVANNAAVRLTSLTVDGLASDIAKTLGDDKTLKQARQNIGKVRERYYWDVVTESLAGHIIKHTRPSDIENFGLLDAINTSLPVSLPRRVAKKLQKLPKYYRNNGLRVTAHAMRTLVSKRTARIVPRKTSKVIFVAHQLDTTGAPHVFIDVVKQFRHKHPNIPFEFHTFNPADKINIRTLNRLGVKPRLYLSKDVTLPTARGDVIVLNTVAFSDDMKNSVFDSLERDIAKQVIWYVHEDEPGIIFDRDETLRIKRLLEKDKIVIYTAAVKTRNHYIEHFGHEKNIHLQIYRIKMAEKRHKIRDAEDFKTLRFILPGMMGDTRKGQLPVAYAFMEFKRRFYDVNPEKYRDFKLIYIGMGKDFPSRQLLKHTGKGLGEHFVGYKPMSHEKCLDEVMKANVTICYSLRECLPMYVYEGMVAGHPILRNDSSGMEEQLKDGVNGFYIDSSDINQLVEQIEVIANKKKTSGSLLVSMSKASHDITLPLENIEYKELIDSIEVAYGEGKN